MADNVRKPRNYKRGRCKAVESAPQLVAELTEEFDASESPFFIGPRTQDAIRIVLQGYEFYKKLYEARCEAANAVERHNP